MKLSVKFTGLFLVGVLIVINNNSAIAQTAQPSFITVGVATNTSTLSVFDPSEVSVIEEKVVEPIKEVEKVDNKYIVASGDSLTLIATKYNTTVQKLFDKNTGITDPDIINIGQEVIIASIDEEIPERAMPVAQVETKPQPAPAPKPKQNTVPKSQNVAGSSYKPRVASDGTNTYYYGYCTWYAKNRRPDLPNGLGNADTWVSRARAMGIATGVSPKVGAIGQRGMHVVFVESINGDNTVTVSEMNAVGWAKISSRTLPASYFTYIY